MIKVGQHIDPNRHDIPVMKQLIIMRPNLKKNPVIMQQKHDEAQS